MDNEEALLELENKRCLAIGSVDTEALKRILSPDYLHVHATGKIDDLAGHLEAIRLRPRTPERRNVRVRIYGDAAVLIGEQINRTPDQTSIGIVQQVAIKQGGHWRFVSTQVTRKS